MPDRSAIATRAVPPGPSEDATPTHSFNSWLFLIISWSSKRQGRWPRPQSKQCWQLLQVRCCQENHSSCLENHSSCLWAFCIQVLIHSVLKIGSLYTWAVFIFFLQSATLLLLTGGIYEKRVSLLALTSDALLALPLKYKLCLLWFLEVHIS